MNQKDVMQLIGEVERGLDQIKASTEKLKSLMKQDPGKKNKNRITRATFHPKNEDGEAMASRMLSIGLAEPGPGGCVTIHDIAWKAVQARDRVRGKTLERSTLIRRTRWTSAETNQIVDWLVERGVLKIRTKPTRSKPATEYTFSDDLGDLDVLAALL